jgi:hypothetical protein
MSDGLEKGEMAPDPVITVGAGRAFFRADLLRQLRRLIDKQVTGRDGKYVLLVFLHK